MQQELLLKTAIVVCASYVLANLFYVLILEAWCVAYGIIY